MSRDTGATRRLAERVAADVRRSCRCGSRGTDWTGFLDHASAHVEPRVYTAEDVARAYALPVEVVE